jgi:glycosyltransferase involved in cell wall biosynthesis
MRVLFLSTWFPYPPDNGARIRVYNLIKALSRKHEVFLVSLLQHDSLRDNALQLKDMCDVVSLHESRWFKPGTWKSTVGFLSLRPRSAVDTFDPKVLTAVREAIARTAPDVVVASTLGVAEYVPRDLGVPSVLEQHNCEYAVLKRSAEGVSGRLRRKRRDLGWRKLARWEGRLCRRFDAVTMVSDGDKALMLQAAPDLTNLHVVPNGVDADHYSAGNRAPEKGAIVYNGALTYDANLDAVKYYADEIYPILVRISPEATLLVTGRTDGVDIGGLDRCPGIELTGYVPDIRDVLHRSRVCAVPLRRGGGSRLKILEAMAAGVPVVSTKVGAEGIDAVGGRHLLLADAPEEFADAIRLVLEDDSLAARLSSDARALVEQQYDWSMIGEGFVRIVESVAHSAEPLARGNRIA